MTERRIGRGEPLPVLEGAEERQAVVARAHFPNSHAQLFGRFAFANQDSLAQKSYVSVIFNG